jgi:transcriptional regulator with XRE-family HTH domain
MRKKDRPVLGKHLAELRQAAGLTQMQLADKLGVHHSNIAFWELTGTPPRGEVLPQMARALGVSVDELLGAAPVKPRVQAPAGKLQMIFARAAKLPRRQQAKLAEFVEAFVERQEKAS